MSADKADTHTTAGITPHLTEILKCRQLAALRLPHPRCRYPWGTLKYILSRDQRRKFKANDILKPTGETGSNGTPLWRTDPAVYRWIQRNLDPQTTCPRGRGLGITNLGDGIYTCTNDDCPCRFDRERAREVLDG